MKSVAFVSYLLARVFISLASTMLSVALGWHLYEFSGNAFDLALVGLMQIIPLWLFFLVTGWAVDHFPRKTILTVCAVVEALVFLGLALSMNSGEIHRLTVFSLLFLHGCARAFYGPAMQSILPNIVPSDLLSRAVAFVSASWTTAQTIGPVIAGVLIAWIDFGVYWLLLLLFVIGASLYGLLPRFPKGKSLERNLDQVLGGLRYVFTNPIVLPSISLDLLIVLLGSVMVLLPVYAQDVLRVGPETLGLLRGMPALGGVAIGLLLAKLPPMRYSGKLLFFSLLVFALSILVFALSSWLWLSLAALCIYGASDMVSVNIRTTLIQLATPDDLRGRVNAVNMLFIGTSNDMGDFRAGSVAAVLGPVAAAAVGAAMAFAVAIGGYYVCPKLRRLDRLTDAQVNNTQ